MAQVQGNGNTGIKIGRMLCFFFPASSTISNNTAFILLYAILFYFIFLF